MFFRRGIKTYRRDQILDALEKHEAALQAQAEYSKPQNTGVASAARVSPQVTAKEKEKAVAKAVSQAETIESTLQATLDAYVAANYSQPGGGLAYLAQNENLQRRMALFELIGEDALKANFSFLAPAPVANPRDAALDYLSQHMIVERVIAVLNSVVTKQGMSRDAALGLNITWITEGLAALAHNLSEYKKTSDPQRQKELADEIKASLSGLNSSIFTYYRGDSHLAKAINQAAELFDQVSNKERDRLSEHYVYIPNVVEHVKECIEDFAAVEKGYKEARKDMPFEYRELHRGLNEELLKPLQEQMKIYEELAANYKEKTDPNEKEMILNKMERALSEIGRVLNRFTGRATSVDRVLDYVNDPSGNIKTKPEDLLLTSLKGAIAAVKEMVEQIDVERKGLKRGGPATKMTF